MQKLKIWLLATAAVLLAACSGGSDDTIIGGGGGGAGGGGGGGGGGGSTAAAITVISSTPTIPSDGSADATLTAFVRDANNALLSGIPVTFRASSGGVAGSPGTTDASGTAAATLVTAGDSTLRTIVVTATAGS